MSQVSVEAEPTLARKKPKSWHAVIGTLSIIIGVLGLICWGCDSINGAAMTAGASLEPASGVEAGASNSTYADVNININSSNDNSSEQSSFSIKSSAQGSQRGPFEIVISFISFLLSIMLLVGGIGLVNRKPWSRSALMLWAWLKIVLTIVWIVFSFSTINDQIPGIEEEMRRSMQEQGNGDQVEVVIGWIKPIVTIGIILIGLFFLIWPLFLVFFLGRDKIKSESDSWGGGMQQNIDGWNGG